MSLSDSTVLRGTIARAAYSICVALAFSGQASAQTPAAAGASSASADDTDQIAPIVVLAQRRKEDAQTVPIAVTAITADAAEKEGITDPQSLAVLVPGLQFNRQVSNSTPFLRGVGTPVGQAGDEPSVAYYVDDVYMPAGSASFSNFNSVDHMEVDKGPQGTLFGRNATGGVIQVFTRDPTMEPTADFTAGYANYSTKSGSLYASSAIAGDLAANVALYGSDQSDGWGTNITTGQPAFGNAWDYGGRVKFLWTPTDATSVLLNLDYDSLRTEEGVGTRAVAGTLDGLGGVPLSLLGIKGLPAAPPSGFYDLELYKQPYTITRQRGVSLKATQDLHWAEFVSITSYRRVDSFWSADETTSFVPLVDYTDTYPEHTVTQEFRLLSAPGSPITWSGGFYYFRDVAGYSPLAFAGAILAPNEDSNALQYTNSYSGFGQATVTVLPDTHLTAGLRYTVDERTLRAFAYFPGGPGGSYVDQPAANSPYSQSWDKLTYRATLDHQFTPDIFGYIGYNRGFKSGLFNTVITPFNTACPTGYCIGPPVKPETLDAYSVGFKTEWFDKRLRVNAEGFWYSYKDIQVEEAISGLTDIYNAAGATIKGIDLDLQAKLARNLTLNVASEVLDGHYTSFPNGVFNVYDPSTGGNIVESKNLAGFQTIQTPPFSLTTSLDYVVPLDTRGSLALDVSWSHGGNYYFNPDNGAGQLSRDFDRQPITNIVNASSSWISGDGSWILKIWGKNITGQKYYSYLSEDAFLTAYSPAPPTTYGATVTYHFGK
jgi:iron complex outermembrane recepter protein